MLFSAGEERAESLLVGRLLLYSIKLDSCREYCLYAFFQYIDSTKIKDKADFVLYSAVCDIVLMMR